MLLEGRSSLLRVTEVVLDRHRREALRTLRAEGRPGVLSLDRTDGGDRGLFECLSRAVVSPG